MVFSSLNPLTQRVVGLMALLPIIALVWVDGRMASIIVLIVTVLMSFEFSRLVNLAKPYWFALALFFSIVAVPDWIIPIDNRIMLVLLIAAMMMINWKKSFPTAGFAILIMVCAKSAQFIISKENGQIVLLAICSVIAACDIVAYFVGRSMGGPKLAPSISPNKTISGSIGGVLAAGILCFFFSNLLGLTPIVALGFGGIIGGLAQFGDLIESQLKRHMGAKDSGKLIPGHGGLLDRFDGYLLTLPTFALVLFS